MDTEERRITTMIEETGKGDMYTWHEEKNGLVYRDPVAAVTLIMAAVADIREIVNPSSVHHLD